MTYGDDRSYSPPEYASEKPVIDRRSQMTQEQDGRAAEIPEALAAILSEPGWERKVMAETPYYYAYTGGPSTFGAKPDVVTVSHWEREGWVLGFFPAYAGANAESVHAASALMRRIEEALSASPAVDS